MENRSDSNAYVMNWVFVYILSDFEGIFVLFCLFSFCFRAC